MPAPVKQRGIAIVGALALLPIAWGLVQHTLSIPEAAKRSMILLVGLWLVERLVLPLLGPMLSPRPEAAALAPVDASTERGAVR